MALADATPLTGGPRPALPEGPPYAVVELADWAGLAFEMPPTDPRLPEIHDGGAAPTPPLDNLVGAVTYWIEHPEWMDFLDPEAPNHHDKLVERALYLDRWARHIPPGCRVLDLGGGVGRFSAWLLEQGCEVELVDPDLRSLWRAVTNALNAGNGKIDLHWSTAERMPELPPFDVVIAPESLCYMEDPELAIQRILSHLKPGGMLLCSVEARWGWAMAADVHEGTVWSWLEDGIIHVPGDRWVRTFEEEELRALLTPFEILEIFPSHYAQSGPFELATGEIDVDTALALEARLRAHPIARGLNRAWMAVARKAL